MKQDVFEQQTRREYLKWLNGPQVEGWQSISATLLRRQHAKVRSAVLAYRRTLNYGHVVPGDRHARGMVDGSKETCTAILAALDRLAGKKGTR